MDVSIVIVNYNMRSLVSECLTSLERLQTDVDFEVFLVDNASSDGSADALRQAFPWISVIENHENAGFARACNQGVRLAHGDYILFLNPDTVLDHNFFRSVEDFCSAHPEAEIAGFKLTDPQGNQHASCWKTPNLFTLCLEMFLPYSLSLPLVTRRPERTCEVEMVSGACMFIRKDAFVRLNGFDSSFFMYYEDADFCLRAREKGLKIFYVPNLTVSHRGSQSSVSDLQQFFIQFYTSKLLFFKKHKPIPVYTTAKCLIILGIIVRISAYYITGLLSVNKKLLRLSKYHTLVLPVLLRRL